MWTCSELLLWLYIIVFVIYLNAVRREIFSTFISKGLFIHLTMGMKRNGVIRHQSFTVSEQKHTCIIKVPGLHYLANKTKSGFIEWSGGARGMPIPCVCARFRNWEICFIIGRIDNLESAACRTKELLLKYHLELPKFIYQMVLHEKHT